jgi:hypothetical protein
MSSFVNAKNGRTLVVSEPTLDDVLAGVRIEFITTLAALTTKGPHDRIARGAAVLLARELFTERLDTLAAKFGGVSRSSISEIVKCAQLQIQPSSSTQRVYPPVTVVFPL